MTFAQANRSTSQTKTNLVLIGMPGAGKSTVGVILAKRLGMQFIDTDLIIQSRHKCRLQEIIDRRGLIFFRRIEEQMLLELRAEHCVIATGGSVIYSQAGMTQLGRNGHCIYLQVSYARLKRRIADMGQRGLVMEKGQDFQQLVAERTPLYRQYADLTIDCGNLSAEQVATTIENEVRQRWPELSI